jgi:PAS domain S-box-containing protein
MNDLTKFTQQLIIARNLDEITAQMQNMVPQVGMVCFLFSVDDNFLTYLSSADPNEAGSDSTLKGLKLPVPQELLEKKDIGPILFKNLKSPTPYSDILTFLDRRGCKSAALLCLIGNEKPVQIIVVGSSEPSALTKDELAPLIELSDQGSKALDRILLTGTLERQKNSQEFFSSLSQLIAQEDDLQAFCQATHKLVQKYFESDIGFSVALVSETDNQISFPYYYERKQEIKKHSYELGDDINSYIVKNEKPLTWNRQGSQILQRLGIVERADLALSFLGLPLRVENKTIGVLSIQDFENEDRFEQIDINFFNNIAPIFASELKNLQEKENVTEITNNFVSQKKLADTIFQHAPFQVYIKDQMGKYTRVNDAALKRFGIEKEDLILGKSDLNLLSEEEGVQSYKDDLEIIASGTRKLGIKSELNRPDGSSIFYTQNKIPIVDESGKVTGLMGIAWDDTELMQVQKVSEQRQERLQTIADIVKSAASSADLNSLLSQSVNLIQQKFNLYHVAAYTIDPLHEFAVYCEGSGEIAQKHKDENYQISLKETSFGKVYASGEKKLFGDTKQEKEYLRDPFLPDTKAALFIPLKIGNEVLGIMDFESKKILGFSEEDINLLQLLSDQMSVAVSNATQSSKLQDYLLRQRSLYLITSNATSAQDIPQALQIVVDGLVTALPKSQIMVFTPDQQGVLSIAASKGYENLDLSTINVKPGDGIVGEVAATRKAIRIEDTAADSRFIPIDKDIRSEIAIPITYRDELLGVLNIESKDVRAFDENDAEILATLGNTLGSIIASVRLVGQIRTQVQRQTQLYQITDKIHRAIDLDSIIQTSAVELCNALNAHKATIQIRPGAISESSAQTNSDAGEKP